MKHEELKRDDIVLFKRYSDICKEEVFQDGSVIGIYPNRREVDVCWLEGYKSRTDAVKYEKVVAKYDKSGKNMKFEEYSGPSILLND